MSESPFVSPKVAETAVPHSRTNLPLAIRCFWCVLLATPLCYLMLLGVAFVSLDIYYGVPMPWYLQIVGLLVPVIAVGVELLGILFWKSVWNLPPKHVWVERGVVVTFAMMIIAVPLVGVFGVIVIIAKGFLFLPDGPALVGL